MLLTKKIKIKWNPRNKKYYMDLGYVFTKMHEEFEIEIRHLQRGSHLKVDLICDYCFEPFTKSYHHYINWKDRSVVPKDCCAKCQSIKNKEVVQLKYQVENVFQLEEVKEKSVNTNILNYGTDNYVKTEEYKERVVKTNNERYGVDWYFQSNDKKEKSRATNIEKYGVDNPMKSEVIKSKLKRVLYENGTAPCSSQQKYIHSIVKGELNYPVGNCSLDIAFPKEKIYVEYDGSGHWLSIELGNETEEVFNKRNKKRDYYLYRRGWKEIRIISRNDILPSKSKIIEMIEWAKDIVNNGRSWVRFDIDNNKVSTSQFETDYNFGHLRKVSNIEKNDVITV